MKLLNGRELAGFIKERQARQVRGLVQGAKVTPKLVIIQGKDDPVINTYIRLKKNYGADIGAEVEHIETKQSDIPSVLKKLNNDDSIHGIIVQLPLDDPSETDRIVNLVSPDKDVDALGENAKFDPATPLAILWLLSGYNVDLKGKKVLLIGRGKLVGAPLLKMLKNSGVDAETIGREVKDLSIKTKPADVIITATGVPGLLKTEMVNPDTVVVDAGVASESGKTVGDLDPAIHEREDLVVTPAKGGVGPLTVSALFENVIISAQRTAGNRV